MQLISDVCQDAHALRLYGKEEGQIRPNNG